MKTRVMWIVGSLLVLGCGDDSSGSGGGGGAEQTNASAGQSGVTSTAATTTGSAASGSTATGAGPLCTQARMDALGPVESVSTGAVAVLEQDANSVTLFVDASAGGVAAQAANPWIYVALADHVRVEVTDGSADSSTQWDIALKRPILRANVGDGGPAGAGGATRLAKEFDDVTFADASVPFETETWFDADCNLATDPTGAISTVFDGWYEYVDMKVLPGAGTWLIRSGDGSRVFRVAILDYYSNPDGSTGQAGGRYKLRVGELVP